MFLRAKKLPTSAIWLASCCLRLALSEQQRSNKLSPVKVVLATTRTAPDYLWRSPFITSRVAWGPRCHPCSSCAACCPLTRGTGSAWPRRVCSCWSAVQQQQVGAPSCPTIFLKKNLSIHTSTTQLYIIDLGNSLRRVVTVVMELLNLTCEQMCVKVNWYVRMVWRHLHF